MKSGTGLFYWGWHMVNPQFMKSGLGGAVDFLWGWEFLRVGTREKFDRGGKNFLQGCGLQGGAADFLLRKVSSHFS
jgi:hypothetical protein